MLSKVNWQRCLLLAMRRLWLEQNARAFGREAASLSVAVCRANDELKMWRPCLARQEVGHGEE